jgi:hypothetical protein
MLKQSFLVPIVDNVHVDCLGALRARGCSAEWLCGSARRLLAVVNVVVLSFPCDASSVSLPILTFRLGYLQLNSNRKLRLFVFSYITVFSCCSVSLFSYFCNKVFFFIFKKILNCISKQLGCGRYCAPRDAGPDAGSGHWSLGYFALTLRISTSVEAYCPVSRQYLSPCL